MKSSANIDNCEVGTHNHSKHCLFCEHQKLTNLLRSILLDLLAEFLRPIRDVRRLDVAALHRAALRISGSGPLRRHFHLSHLGRGRARQRRCQRSRRAAGRLYRAARRHCATWARLSRRARCGSTASAGRRTCARAWRATARPSARLLLQELRATRRRIGGLPAEVGHVSRVGGAGRLLKYD